MAEYLIYKHTSPSGKAYIGQTKNLRQRNASHKVPSAKHTPFRCAIQKYGWDAFKHEVLVENLTLDEANELEEQLIKEHNTIVPQGYNLRSGGENQLFTDETKQRLSQQRKGKPRSPEHQAKLNEAARNRVRSPAHTAKLLEAARRPKSEETKRKMSEANKGRTKSKEHRRKLSEANKGKKYPSERGQRQSLRNTGRRIYVDPTTGKRRYWYPTETTTFPLDKMSSSV